MKQWCTSLSSLVRRMTQVSDDIQRLLQVSASRKMAAHSVSGLSANRLVKESNPRLDSCYALEQDRLLL